MKKALFLVSVLSLLIAGCESYQNQDAQEQQERQAEEPTTPMPVPEHGGGAGNK